MSTQQNRIAGLALIAGLLIGCGEAGPARGTPEWYWQSAMTAYGEGRFPAALQELADAADSEGEVAARATVLTGVLTAALARGNIQLADACRAGIEKQAEFVTAVRAPLQQADRDAKQNLISFVQGLGDFEKALGTGDVTLAFPFPPGNRAETSNMESLKSGMTVGDVQLADSVRETLQLGILETFAMAAGLGDDVEQAQAKFDAGAITVPGPKFRLIVAGFLLDMSGVLTQKKMNDPKLRDALLQRTEQWIAPELESSDAAVKERAEEIKFDIENERRDIKLLEPLKRS